MVKQEERETKKMLRFYNPWFFLGLLIIPLYLYWELRVREKQKLRLPFNRISLLKKLSKGSGMWKYLFPILRSLVLIALIVAIARPRWGEDVRDLKQKGVDIILAIDVSGSMLAMDFKPDNRLNAAKKVAQDFIKKRPNDRFGLVAFSEYAITQCPLTFDHNTTLEQLEKLSVNESASATAVGMGLAKAVARLKDSSAKSKLIILITDGVSNTGEIDPISAAEMALSLGIKVYPIGVGSNGYVDFPVQDPLFGTRYQKVLIELDLESLDRIAALTGTDKAALATDSERLQDVMNKIDRLEKTTFQTKIRYIWKEQFMLFLWIAFGILLAEILSKTLWYPVMPE